MIDATFKKFVQNLHFNSQELPCFVSGVTYSSPLKGGHGVVCFSEIEKLLGVKDALLKYIFTKQLTTESCARKLGVLADVVVKNNNYSMKHIRSGGLKHTA
jgi:hypothetical protein